MAEPTVVLTSTTVPREDLGRRESLLTTSKKVKKITGIEREGWWRLTVTNTPIPGTYHLRTFIEEALLNPVSITYNFKNEGRKRIPLVLRNDPVPTDLPQYSPPDFLELLKKQTASYSFKDKPRADPSTLVEKDKELRISFFSSKIPTKLFHSCHMCAAPVRLEMSWDHRALELRTVVNFHMVIELEPRSSEKAGAPNSWAIPPDPKMCSN
nr:protein STPG4 isoform X4 [Rattus norvegicus]